ncbi:uncharacterized protein LOC118150274 isoform X10 [Callithrix jacchus]
MGLWRVSDVESSPGASAAGKSTIPAGVTGTRAPSVPFPASAPDSWAPALQLRNREGASFPVVLFWMHLKDDTARPSPGAGPSPSQGPELFTSCAQNTRSETQQSVLNKPLRPLEPPGIRSPCCSLWEFSRSMSFRAPCHPGWASDRFSHLNPEKKEWEMGLCKAQI